MFSFVCSSAYHGEPPDQRIPSRHGYQGPGQEGFYLNGSFVQSQTSIEMNPMGHHPDSRTTFQSQPMMQPYAVVPGNVPYNVHHPPYLPTAHAQYAHPANVIIIPVNQDMVRDTSTPIPSTEGNIKLYNRMLQMKINYICCTVKIKFSFHNSLQHCMIADY